MNDLRRFVEAQEGQYQSVLSELRSGRKTSHWMWYIFPQIRGLGSSAMAERYAIATLDEATGYLAHPLLGPRLRESTQLVVDVHGRAVGEIFPYPDDLKFRSSMTLFARAQGATEIFVTALDKYFDGQPDPLTVEILQRQAAP